MHIDLLHPKVKFSLFKSGFFVFSFLIICSFLLFASAYSLTSLKSSKGGKSSSQPSSTSKGTGVSLYASLPEERATMNGVVKPADARVIILQRFFESYDSVLAEHAGFLVQTADKYSLDYRLVPAITMKESGGCKAIPVDSYNCTGWGIHSAGTMRFDSYEEALEAVSKGLKENYIDLGYVTVEEIMSKYAHPDSTTWADGVLFYMEQMI